VRMRTMMSMTFSVFNDMGLEIVDTMMIRSDTMNMCVFYHSRVRHCIVLHIHISIDENQVDSRWPFFSLVSLMCFDCLMAWTVCQVIWRSWWWWLAFTILFCHSCWQYMTFLLSHENSTIYLCMDNDNEILIHYFFNKHAL
jgi:hypothetical protein